MKRKSLLFWAVMAGIGGLFMAGRVASGQFEDNKGEAGLRAWGCCPYYSECPYCPRHGYECRGNCHEEETNAQVVADQSPREEQPQTEADAFNLRQPDAEEAAGDTGSEAQDYWYDSQTKEFHSYDFGSQPSPASQAMETERPYNTDCFDDAPQQSYGYSPKYDVATPQAGQDDTTTDVARGERICGQSDYNYSYEYDYEKGHAAESADPCLESARDEAVTKAVDEVPWPQAKSAGSDDGAAGEQLQTSDTANAETYKYRPWDDTEFAPPKDEMAEGREIQVVEGEDSPSIEDQTEKLEFGEARAEHEQMPTEFGEVADEHGDDYAEEMTDGYEADNQPSADSTTPADRETSIYTSPDVLLSVARALDQLSDTLQCISRYLTQMAEQGTARTPAASSATLQR